MREETIFAQQSTSSEANSRVASLDIGFCYYSVHKRPTLSSTLQQFGQFCSSASFVTVIHLTLSTDDEGRHYAVFSSLHLPLLSYGVFICPNFLLNTLFSNTHRLY